MTTKHPIIYIIAGCNGAGKTTFAREFLPKEVKCLRFFNADEIARGLSPFDPSFGAIKAGRLLLEEIRETISQRKTFAFESTLSGRTYLNLLKQARTDGFHLYLYYLWLPKVELAIARVKERVKKGGHNVPTIDVRRRFYRSLKNVLSYAVLMDQWLIWDSQKMPPQLKAESKNCSLENLKLMLE